MSDCLVANDSQQEMEFQTLEQRKFIEQTMGFGDLYSANGTSDVFLKFSASQINLDCVSLTNSFYSP